jgi:hypothetical protein
MRIIIAGGTGFLGRPLTAALAADGHQVVVLSRGERSPDEARPDAAPGAISTVAWRPDGSAGPWAAAVDGARAVVNLAGESLAARRWSAAQKARLVDSRILSTRSLVAAIKAAAHRPEVFVTNVGVGYYGTASPGEVTEQDAPGSDFLARLSVRWEDEASAASAFVGRVVLLRTGVVLAKDGGALARMVPAFRAFAGGPIGSGRQPMSWIHLADWIAIVRWTLATPAAVGPINATSPHPVANEEFARALGRALHRPSAMRVPAVAIKLMFGEMGETVLLGGQAAVPARAQQLGFRFTWPDIGAALEDVFRQDAPSS